MVVSDDGTSSCPSLEAIGNGDTTAGEGAEYFVKLNFISLCVKAAWLAAACSLRAEVIPTGRRKCGAGKGFDGVKTADNECEEEILDQKEHTHEEVR